MDRRPTWTNCDEAGDYVVPNVLSPRYLVFRPDNMGEVVLEKALLKWEGYGLNSRLYVECHFSI